jgi:hypothetical protein
MLKGTGLDDLCETGNTTEELQARLKDLFTKDFTIEESVRRSEQLKICYDNMVNGHKMLDLIYNP